MVDYKYNDSRERAVIGVAARTPARCRRYRGAWKRNKLQKQNGASLTPAPFGEVLGQEKLNGFCRRGTRVSRCRLRKSAAAGFLLGALVDLDETFKIAAVTIHYAQVGP